MKKKICIITSSFPSSVTEAKSAGVFVRDFALLLAEQGFDVHVLAPKTKSSSYDDDRIHVHFFPWFGGEMGLSSYNPKNPIHLIRLSSAVLSGLNFTLRFVKKNKIDYCLAMWAVPAGLFAWVTKVFSKTPYAVWVLGSDIWKIKDYPFGKFILKKVLKNSRIIYADGLQLAKDVTEISREDCKFLASSRILSKDLKECDYKKFVSTKKNFMFLGRYHTNKGVDLLVDAVNLLSFEDRKKSAFHIFGGGPLEKKIKEMVNDFGLNDCIFINDYLKADEVFSYMEKSDFIIIPSRIESIPLVLSDAMQAKKPLIVTSVGDMGKLVNEFRVGLVADPIPESLSEKIFMAINFDQKKLESFNDEMNKLRSYLDLRNSVKLFAENVNS